MATATTLLSRRSLARPGERTSRALQGGPEQCVRRRLPRDRGRGQSPRRPLDSERGEERAMGTRIDREPGERPSATARPGQAVRGGAIGAAEPRPEAVVNEL